MTRFVWYIVDLQDGSVTGTNDTEKLHASGMTKSDDYVVIHKDSGTSCDPTTGECNMSINEAKMPSHMMEDDEESEDGA